MQLLFIFSPLIVGSVALIVYLRLRRLIPFPVLWETVALGFVGIFLKAFFFEILNLGPFGLILYGYPLLLLIVVFPIWILVGNLGTLSSLLSSLFRQKRIQRQRVIALGVLGISLVGFIWINPLMIDFNLYRSPREAVIHAITTGELQPTALTQNGHSILPETAAQATRSKQILIVEQDPDLVLQFERYYIGLGDGLASYLYRADNQDISITLEAYEANRPPNGPSSLFIKKLDEHWFWQVEKSF